MTPGGRYPPPFTPERENLADQDALHRQLQRSPPQRLGSAVWVSFFSFASIFVRISAGIALFS